MNPHRTQREVFQRLSSQLCCTESGLEATQRPTPPTRWPGEPVSSPINKARTEVPAAAPPVMSQPGPRGTGGVALPPTPGVAAPHPGVARPHCLRGQCLWGRGACRGKAPQLSLLATTLPAACSSGFCRRRMHLPSHRTDSTRPPPGPPRRSRPGLPH
ncbi:PREDICTED: translation initiation factor IF-2-like [Chinchilla lanigera]|uniref:translation initiation factor IF-2-like n=1 Tax=Chinchilla lanigera TaxID=34839 RepID=UPI0006991B7F|nr:PREDICTED: translation initiation factor IF-2-like [Chinchilla lanigera]